MLAKAKIKDADSRDLVIMNESAGFHYPSLFFHYSPYNFLGFRASRARELGRIIPEK